MYLVTCNLSWREMLLLASMATVVHADAIARRSFKFTFTICIFVLNCNFFSLRTQKTKLRYWIKRSRLWDIPIPKPCFDHPIGWMVALSIRDPGSVFIPGSNPVKVNDMDNRDWQKNQKTGNQGLSGRHLYRWDLSPPEHPESSCWTGWADDTEDAFPGVGYTPGLYLWTKIGAVIQDLWTGI